MNNLKKLEKVLEHIDKKLFNDYRMLVEELREKVYPNINTSLALKVGIYTNHDGEHFDLVVEQAGNLLQADKILQIVSKKNDIHDFTCEEKNIFFFLNAFELFILLCSIRVHDIGLLIDRIDHASTITYVISILNINIGKSVKRIIAEISGAHTGKTNTGSEDKISTLSKIENIKSYAIRPKMLAAIVRFSDELEEGEHRTSKTNLITDKIPENNKVFHKYSLALIDLSINHHGNSIDIKFEIEDRDKAILYTKPDGMKVTILEEISHRLKKIERERKYFYRFLCNSLIIESINSTIDFTDEYDNVIKTITVKTYEEYPHVDSYGLEQLDELVNKDKNA